MVYPIQNNVRNRLSTSRVSGISRPTRGNVGKERLVQWPDRIASYGGPGKLERAVRRPFQLFRPRLVRDPHLCSGKLARKRVFVRVGSASYFGTVYVNGQEAGSHEGGHLPFAFEITNLILWDAENVIAISVENELKPTRVPSGNMNYSSWSCLPVSRARPTISSRSRGFIVRLYFTLFRRITSKMLRLSPEINGITGTVRHRSAE